jgi:pantothenate kinase type III
MLLVVDVGNTQTHFGVFREGEDQIAESWRFATVRESTGDELGAALSNLLALRGLSPGEIDDSIVSSTVPQLSEQWTLMAERYLHKPMLVVGPSIRTGMPIRMDNPHEVGADRLVNAVAAYEHVHGTCVVVDFGTAITYDVVSAAGEYLGGIITPGAEISIDALYDRAAKLPKVDGRRDPQRHRLRVRRPGRGHRRPPASGARRIDPGDRHRRTGGSAGAVRPRDDRRGRRPAYADRAPADLATESKLIAGTGTSGVRATVAARIRNTRRRRLLGSTAATSS